MIVIGIGTTSAATADDIVAAVHEVEGRAGSPCRVLASLRRGGELDRVIANASAAIDCRMQLLALDELKARSNDCITRSAASIGAYAISSVAEAAALAGAGPGSRLLMARIVFDRVTVAVAELHLEEHPL